RPPAPPDAAGPPAPRASHGDAGAGGDAHAGRPHLRRRVQPAGPRRVGQPPRERAPCARDVVLPRAHPDRDRRGLAGAPRHGEELVPPRSPRHEEIARRSGGMMALDDVDLQDQAVQYVLGELAAGDAVRRLRATLGLLPHAVAADPPPALRAQVLSAAEAQHRARRTRPRRVVWSQFAAAIAATVAIAFGLDSYRTRQELAMQQ